MPSRDHPDFSNLIVPAQSEVKIKASDGEFPCQQFLAMKN